ncbi:MAG: YdeI/OmpD-associated family protein [Bifidobacteriaceae bacterium]|jgi:uncharacterized protein YdeI (YjbR/CyaY-like superfamily)|nr:YdeI/OmpD-associated family protein [Bifidobacteriaceae bacterium]
MRDTELLFETREAFRAWLAENAETSDGVWLVFGKRRSVVTLTANEALEEALCFGWIDGQMRSVDDTRYLKCFARRRGKSVWSAKNKRIVQTLRDRQMMAPLGERAVAVAVKNGLWDAPGRPAITDEQVEAFAERLEGVSPARENFAGMSPSVRRAYVGRHLSFKSEEARQRDFARIIDRLDRNLKPM